MTHPDDQLAAYVDGSLAPEERSVVEAHLEGCVRCRDEVALAAGARTALAELAGPVDVPAEVGRPAIDEAARRGADVRTATDHPRWYRWVGGVAAAAAVVLGIAITIPALRGGDADTSAEMAADGAGASAKASSGPRSVEKLEGNLTAADLPGLADPVRDTLAAGAAAEDQDASAPQATEDVEFAAADRAAAAAACLRTAFPAVTAAPLRIVEIRFERTPAYGGVYFVAGGTETEFGTFEFDVLQVVVASRADCSLLATSPVTP